MKFEDSNLNLSSGLTAPLHTQNLTEDFTRKALPSLVNKLTLSNFVDLDYLESLKSFLNLLPEDLRHVYTTSGQSECVDKLFKSLWWNNKNHNLITFEGCYFGSGSFLSRALSGEKETYFEVDRLKYPTEDNWQGVLADIKRAFEVKKYSSVWVEPVMQKTLQNAPFEFLKSLRNLCTEHEVALVYNETASQGYRYQDTFFASEISEIQPDLGMVFLGGQMGIVFTQLKYFVKEPLTLISTWDGDAYSLHAHLQGYESAIRNKLEFLNLQNQFTEKLKADLKKSGVKEYFIERGRGWVSTDAPWEITKFLNFSEKAKVFTVCPNITAMNIYLKTEVSKWI